MWSVRKSWEQIERTLVEHLPEIAKSLGPPATAKQLFALEKSLGCKLPRDLLDSLSIHNGMTSNRYRLKSVFEYDIPLTATGIARAAKMMRRLLLSGCWEGCDGGEIDRGRIKDAAWSIGWVPVTDFDGDSYIVDLDPGSRGKPGQVWRRSNVAQTHGVVANSWREFLELFAVRLAAGKLKICDGTLLLTSPIRRKK